MRPVFLARSKPSMFSQTVEYALRAVVTIAQGEGRPCTARAISENTAVPSPYLSKLMQLLVHGGIVNSQRGPHGGFVLSKDPSELTVYDVVNVVEPIKRIRVCPLDIPSHDSVLCPLHARLDEALEAIETMFRQTTVAALLSAPGRSTPLCASASVFNLSDPQN